MKSLHAKFKMSYVALAALANVTYPTLMRWKERVESGNKPVNTPGPKVVKEIDVNELKNLKKKIHSLKHGRKRSKGSTSLRKQYRGMISRRDFQKLVIQARGDFWTEKDAEKKIVVWHYPGTAWALDDTEDTFDGVSKSYINNTQDLGSKFKFRPVTGDSIPKGEEIAGHLDFLFNRFGPPLFLKRDNGSNLNHIAVNQVLNEFSVIPLNSPPRCPEYNGGIEHTQHEMKKFLKDNYEDKFNECDLGLLAQVAANELNHKPRRCLGERNSCQTFSPVIKKNQFNKRRRKEVFEWIENLSLEILNEVNNVSISKAWRLASETWLQKNNHISVFKKEKVLPRFESDFYHN